jgi:hypothetical protein
MALVFKEPGVVVSEEENPTLAVPTAGFNVSAIVGPGMTTVDVENVAVVRTAGTTDAIPNVDAVEIVGLLGVGASHGFANYNIPADVQLDASGFVDWSPGGSEPTLGATYYVSYKKNKDSSYYDYTKYTDPDQFFKVVGYPISNGEVNKLAVLGALAFEAGAPVIGVVQVVNESLS